MSDERLIVALDYNSLDEALSLVDELGDMVVYYKVGSVLFTAVGPEVIRLLKDRGKKIFLDLKYHDIPNTVALAVKNAMTLGVDMLNVHAQGGGIMMREAAKEAKGKAIILGVTILTSFDKATLAASDLWMTGEVVENVARLASLAHSAGLDGVVCSPQEIAPLREVCGPDFTLVCPGIRPIDGDIDDQKRVMPPYLALMEGADYLVVGRPITKAKDRLAAVRNILDDMNGVEASG